MDLNFGGNSLQDIAALVAALVALGLALQTAVGPTVMFLTEAVKSAYGPSDGKAGLIAAGIGMAIGLCLGLLTAIVTTSDVGQYIGLALCGLFAGLFMGAGAVQNHKAAGSINVDAPSENAPAPGGYAVDSFASPVAESAVNPNFLAYVEAQNRKEVELAKLNSTPKPEDGATEGDAPHDFDSIIQAGPGAVDPSKNQQAAPAPAKLTGNVF